ncbi:hypothetical protein [Woodsholea maritima]|uniref:hypothetical protein n=1 Tax=Woodsholea maritima TaxID=240237 RepID=UPI0003747721|nr:hypothetical protein [Woodsholea maritima]
MSDPLPNGLYLVYAYPENSDHPDDIAFELTLEARDIPPAYSQLKSNIERTLSVLRALYQPQDKVFKDYYGELLALAQYGLKGPTAQPQQAELTLANLQQRFHNSEKGKVISQHMTKTLKLYAIVFGTCAALALLLYGLLVLTPWAFNPVVLSTLPGLCLGLTLTAFMRCKTVNFYDLHAIDADRFSPWMRAAFALVLLCVTAIFLKAGVFQIEVGELAISEFDAKALSGLLFGLVVGITQEPLIARIEAIAKKPA